jgi:hypothetical protein
MARSRWAMRRRHLRDAAAMAFQVELAFEGY